MIKYEKPVHWIKYDPAAISAELAEAKAAILSLATMPYQRDWVESLQEMELKREVAGTSRIEGADFTERELDAALSESPEELVTRSQRQARAAKIAYRWISQLPLDKPLDADLIKDVHRRIIASADDDHCEPGRVRRSDENVTFGQPRHRGVNGGTDCEDVFGEFTAAIIHEFSKHDPIVQALAAHYHIAAMHPFCDGNGRTARAIEALMLQRAGLRSIGFIAMSNYYYDEKIEYLNSLNLVRAMHHDLTPFLKFALKGIALQCHRLLREIKLGVQKALFRNMMYDLFNRLKTPRKRVIRDRQIEILKLLLDVGPKDLGDIYARMKAVYSPLRAPIKAFVRDVSGLEHLMAVSVTEQSKERYIVTINLDWPTQITESTFFERLKTLPQAKSYPFLS